MAVFSLAQSQPVGEQEEAAVAARERGGQHMLGFGEVLRGRRRVQEHRFVGARALCVAHVQEEAPLVGRGPSAVVTKHHCGLLHTTEERAQWRQRRAIGHLSSDGRRERSRPLDQRMPRSDALLCRLLCPPLSEGANREGRLLRRVIRQLRPVGNCETSSEGMHPESRPGTPLEHLLPAFQRCHFPPDWSRRSSPRAPSTPTCAYSRTSVCA